MDIRIEFKRTDDRRNKDYANKVSAYAGMEFIPRCDDEYYQHGFNVARDFEDRLKALFPEPVNVRVSRDSYERSERNWAIFVSKKIKADKPSLIVSNEVARESLPTEEIIITRIEVARRDTMAARAKHLEHTRSVSAASHVMEEQRKRFIKKTEVNTRFKQRLAALVAEHDAEYKALRTNEDPSGSMYKEL